MKEWTQLEECSVYCRCGSVFRAKHQIDYETRTAQIDRDCPGCGKRLNVWRASYDPETFTI